VQGELRVRGKPRLGEIKSRLDLCLFVCNLFLIDMADQHPAQSAKKSRGFLNHLKKVFRPGSSSQPSSQSNTPRTELTTNPEEVAKLRAKYTHFRILVIGRANAGKTTLLKRVCNTKEDPVYNMVRYQLRFENLLLPSLNQQINPTSKVPYSLFLLSGR